MKFNEWILCQPDQDIREVMAAIFSRWDEQISRGESVEARASEAAHMALGICVAEMLSDLGRLFALVRS